MMQKSPEKQPYLLTAEALNTWSTTQGRIEIIEEDKPSDQNINHSIRECPPDQEEDSEHHIKGSPFYLKNQLSQNFKDNSPQSFS